MIDDERPDAIFHTRFLLSERDKEISELRKAIGIVQMLQPNSSPPPGGICSLIGWITRSVIDERAELRQDKARFDKLSRLGVDKLWLQDGREFAARSTDLRYVIDGIEEPK